MERRQTPCAATVCRRRPGGRGAVVNALARRHSRPSSSRRSRWPLVGVACGDVARDSGALVEIAPDRQVGGSRAGAITLLKSPIAAIEARHQPVAPFPTRGLCLDQRLHFVAPGLTLVGTTDAAQMVERTQNFS